MNLVDIDISFAKEKDIEALIEVYNEWSKFKNILPAELTEGETNEGLMKYFDDSIVTRKYLIARDHNGVPVGACYIDITFLGLKNIRLGDMIVKEAHRSQGIGSKLVDEVITFARQNKCIKLWLWTQKPLTSAIRLYEKKGFVLEGTLPKQFCGEDALQYGLVLYGN